MPAYLLVIVVLSLIYWPCASVYVYRRLRDRSGPFGPAPVLPSFAFAIFVGPVFLPILYAVVILASLLGIEPYFGIGFG